MWMLFLAMHVVGLTGFNLILRKSLVDKVDRWTLATIMQTGIAIPMLFALFIAPPDLSLFTPEILLRTAIILFLVIALHYTNVKSLEYLEAGVYAVLYNLRIIFATILGILFLSENIIPLQIIGGIFILIAVFTVRQKGKKEVTLNGIKWGIAASLVISFLNMFEKALIRDVGYLTYAIPVFILATLVMWTVLLHKNGNIPIRQFVTRNNIALMILRAASAYGAGLALAFGATLSLYTYISSLSVIVTVVLGMLLLNETDYLKQKLFATALAVAGFTFILLANL